MSVYTINVTKTTASKLPQVNFDELPFGKIFTDHMLVAKYENGVWGEVEIKPYQPLSLDPSLSAIHYGQSIFEGVKAYKDDNGKPFVFRPQDNFKRFNRSAERMNMPAVPEEIFMGGLKELIALDADWIPTKADHSLYIRPFMFSTDAALGVRPSSSYLFIIILSPTGPYFANPMKILVEGHYTRATPGGTGFAKSAGNYAGSLLAATKANSQGFDQVLWTDSTEHKWLQEVGMMNVFFIVNGKAITPELSEGTILEGVTRASVIQGLKDKGIEVEERRINIDEIVEAYQQNAVTEVFGTGTAAVIAPVQELNYQGVSMKFDTNAYKIAPAVKEWLNDIRAGKIEDKFGWIWYVN